LHWRSQHSLNARQATPTALHIVVPPHVPPMQLLSQQVELTVHAVPLGLHAGAGAAQRPPLQVLLQQSDAWTQARPLAAHTAGVWQLPALQSWLQQALADAQAAPCAAHAGCAHEPFVQIVLQQSVALAHDCPEARHVGFAHMPAWHRLLQQSLAAAQPWPVDRHICCSQIPPEHDMLQQSVNELHVAPPARHWPAGTGVLTPESIDVALSPTLLSPFASTGGDIESPEPESYPCGKGSGLVEAVLPQPPATMDTTSPTSRAAHADVRKRGERAMKATSTVTNTRTARLSTSPWRARARAVHRRNVFVP